MLQHIEDLRPLFARRQYDRLLITTPNRSVVVLASEIVAFKLDGVDAYRFGGMGTISETDVIVSQIDETTNEVVLDTDRGPVSLRPLVCDSQNTAPHMQRTLHF